MPVPDRHESKEKEIFSHFAEHCALPIRPGSIVKRKPLKPDILCEIKEEGPLAFEMVELIDEGLAQRTYGQIKLQELLKDTYQSLPVNVRSEVEKRLGNALVHVEFNLGMSSRARESAIPRVFEILQEITPSFVGDFQPQVGSPLHKLVIRITVRRGQFVGPCFDVEAGGFFADPTIYRITQKFKKKYSSSAPIELLAYYELQPVLPESIWLPKLQTFTTQHLRSSGFRRVWVYDIKRNAVKFVYPEVSRANC